MGENGQKEELERLASELFGERHGSKVLRIAAGCGGCERKHQIAIKRAMAGVLVEAWIVKSSLGQGGAFETRAEALDRAVELGWRESSVKRVKNAKLSWLVNSRRLSSERETEVVHDVSAAGIWWVRWGQLPFSISRTQ